MDLQSLMAGFIFGVIGVWLIRQARGRGDFSLLGVGLALIVYPYFVTNPYALWGIGGALSLYGLKTALTF